MTSISDFDIPNRLISRYSHIGSSRANDDLFGPTNAISQQDFREALDTRIDAGKSTSSFYVHLPFCPVRCLNCDNNAVITHEAAPIDRYLDSLERELTMVSQTAGNSRPLQQIHLGGGSPNYLNDRQLVRLMAMIDDCFNIDDNTEMSLDANPKRTSPSQLALLGNLGFDRIHFGLRDLDPKVQLAIGRTTSKEMIRDVFETAREAGFSTIGVDMMYGLPCQTEDGLKRSVEELIALLPDRIACTAYSRRTLDRNHQVAIDQCTMPSLADKLSLFNALVDGFSTDYDWIGLDNFARHDDELSKAQAERRLHRTWLGYSHLPPTDLFGFGTNAVTDLRAICVQNHLQPKQWHEAIGSGDFPIRGGVHLRAEHRLKRNAIRGLMCNMEIEDYSALMGSDEATERTWAGYATDGLLSITPEAMRLTPQGRYLLPHLLS